jgi:hypothetical protein
MRMDANSHSCALVTAPQNLRLDRKHNEALRILPARDRKAVASPSSNPWASWAALVGRLRPGRALRRRPTAKSVAAGRRDTNATKSTARDIGKKRKEVMVLELPHVRELNTKDPPPSGPRICFQRHRRIQI